MAKVPKLPDIQTIAAMFPDRTDDCLAPFKANIKKILRVNDEQLSVQRYKWFNLFPELSGNLIERILYYRGRGMLFYIPEMKRWYFLPFTLNGDIDVYGRYTQVSPLPFMGKDEAKTENGKRQAALFSAQLRTPVYDIDDIEGITPEEFLAKRCVLIYDYTPQLSQYIQPRQDMNDGLIEMESNLLPYLNTLLSNNTGVAGLRVSSADEQASVETASQTANLAALNGRRWMAIMGQLDFQDLSPSGASARMRAEDYLLSMQAIDNFRLGTYGLDNGGLFNKKSYQNLEQTQNMGGQSSIVMEDGLNQRQRACDIVNNYVLSPMGMALEELLDCQVSECAMGGDSNLDMMVGNEGNTDQQPSPAQAAATTEGGASNGNE